MTSAHANLADAVDELAARLDALTASLAAILAAQDGDKVGPAQAERALGHKPGYFSPSRHPYRVPHYGARGSRWTVREWREWNAVPDGQRRAEWDAIPLARRSEICVVLVRPRKTRKIA